MDKLKADAGGGVGTAGVAIPAVAVEMVCCESMCANMERCQFPHACREQPRTSGVLGTQGDKP